jgi:hypothetical protein
LKTPTNEYMSLCSGLLLPHSLRSVRQLPISQHKQQMVQKWDSIYKYAEDCVRIPKLIMIVAWPDEYEEYKFHRRTTSLLLCIFNYAVCNSSNQGLAQCVRCVIPILYFQIERRVRHVCAVRSFRKIVHAVRNLNIMHTCE